MATYHWIIICGIHHVQVGITAGCGRVDRIKEMRMVMLIKMVTVAMIPLPMALWRHRERGEEVANRDTISVMGIVRDVEVLWGKLNILLIFLFLLLRKIAFVPLYLVDPS